MWNEDDPESCVCSEDDDEHTPVLEPAASGYKTIDLFGVLEFRQSLINAVTTLFDPRECIEPEEKRLSKDKSIAALRFAKWDPEKAIDLLTRTDQPHQPVQVLVGVDQRVAQ